MEMLSSVRGDKHELCLVVIKFKQKCIGCSVSRCSRQAEFTLLHFMIFH